MLTAIDFNNESALLADEINNERSNWRLTPESKTIKTMRSQGGPQATLRVSHVVTQRSRKAPLRRCNSAMRHWLQTPLPDRFAVRPPPQGGR